MTIARRLLLCLLLLALAAPAFARPGDEEEKLKEARAKWGQLTEEQQKRILEAWERWKKLTEEERRLRERVFDEHMKGSTPKEREEFAAKLAQVKRRKDLEELRRKQERMREVVAKFEEALPDDVRTKLETLPEGKREAVRTFAVVRMSEVLRDRFMESLTAEERDRMRGFEGRERGDHLMKSHLQRVLDRLTDEEKKELEALPEPERRMRLYRLLKDLHDEDLRIAREAVAGEVAEVLDLPATEMEERLRAPRIFGVLRELGVGGDHDLTRRLTQLPWDRLQRSLGRLREISEIENPRERRRALEEFREKLGLEGVKDEE